MKDITRQEQEKILDHLHLQLNQIQENIPLDSFRKIKVTCPDCNTEIGMLYMYRCYQCGLWICIKCAPKHFNIDRSKLPRYIK